MHLKMYVKDIGSWASMVILQNYQNVTEMTSNMIYIVAFGGGLKYPHKIHLNTQCTAPVGIGLTELLNSGGY